MVTMLLAVIFAIRSGWRRNLENIHNSQRESLAPLIRAVDIFIERNQRCPTRREFDTIADELDVFAAIFNTGTQYVKELGGVGNTDYVLGTWDGDVNHCYRSWDGRVYFDDTQRLYDYFNGKK